MMNGETLTDKRLRERTRRPKTTDATNICKNLVEEILPADSNATALPISKVRFIVETGRPKITDATNIYKNLPIELKLCIYNLAAPLDSKTIPPDLGDYQQPYCLLSKTHYPRSSTIFPFKPIPQGTTSPSGKLFPRRSPKVYLQWIKVLRADVSVAARHCQRNLRLYIRCRDQDGNSTLMKTTISHSNLSNILLVLWRVHGFPNPLMDEHNEVWTYLNHVRLRYLEEVDQFLLECASKMGLSAKAHRSPKYAWRCLEEFKGIGMEMTFLKMAVWNLLLNGIHVTASGRTAKLREAVMVKEILKSKEHDKKERKMMRDGIRMLCAKSHTTTSSVPSCFGENGGFPRWHFTGAGHTFNQKNPNQLARAGYHAHFRGIRGNGLCSLKLPSIQTQRASQWLGGLPPSRDRFKMFHDVLPLRHRGISKTFQQWSLENSGDASYTFMRYAFWHWAYWKIPADETLGILGMETKVVKAEYGARSGYESIRLPLQTIRYSIVYSYVAAFEETGVEWVIKAWNSLMSSVDQSIKTETLRKGLLAAILPGLPSRISKRIRDGLYRFGRNISLFGVVSVRVFATLQEEKVSSCT
ncbi:hypothetical protein BKA80DRAFT_332427 [Phyllosticta citrichinensis]